MHITVIGTGNMAKGIGTRLVAGNHTVTIHGKDEAKATALATGLQATSAAAQVTAAPLGSTLDEIVILAVPYPEIASVASHYNNFNGKIVVDITNPVDFTTFELIPSAGVSGAEEVAKLLPQAKIVKAFNTTLAGPLEAGSIEGKELDVFIAGDNEDASAQVAEMIKTSGMRPIMVGPLSESRHLEGFGLIQMKIQDQIGTGWMSALKFLG